MHQVVITGAGVVSPIGTTVAEFGKRMFAGESGAVDIRGKLVASDFPVPVAAPVLRDPKAHEIGSAVHSLRILATATEEAIRSLPEGLPISGVVYGGSNVDSGISFGVQTDHATGANHVAGSSLGSTPIDLIRRVLEARGHGPLDDRDLISLNNVTVSSNQAIGLAFQRIRSGMWKRAIVSAVYGRCGPRDLMNFYLLGTLNTNECRADQASRPFSADRSGFVLGEGGATLVLEERTSSERRGATILGSIAGYATTSDAYRITDGRTDAKAASTAMRKAIRDAGLADGEIDAISAHGTSTRMNDRLETLAIKKALGQAAYDIPVISLKSQIGHCLAAAGALEAVASLLMLSEQKLAPTINYKQPDPDCDLDYVPNESRAATLDAILSNNFGFGGQNSCLVLAKA